MLFNSYVFIFLFLPVAFIIYHLLNASNNHKSARVWLILCSLFFYSHWNIIYLPLIILSIGINFTIAKYLKEKKRFLFFTPSKLLFIGITANVLLLVYYKYMDFFILNTNFVFGTDFVLWNLVLPLAISFFTLQQIAYLVDCYEGLIKDHKFIDYSVFVCFFPQLIAGPIVHHSEMMPQFRNSSNHKIIHENIAKGLLIFSIGLFKKVVIADSLSLWVIEGFDNSSSLNLIEGWIASISYTFQIYFDFSGYADMAIGAALLFNIRLPINFNSPYKATGVIDYWKRWHITLTVFITTYVYTPILRSFSSITLAKAMVATFVAMFISGLWHGAGWTFIVWGSLHGLALVINHLWQKSRGNMTWILAWFITFNFINITSVFFRANSLDDAFKVLRGMVGLGGIELPSALSPHLGFLSPLNIEYGRYIEELGYTASAIAPWILISMMLAFFFRNSTELADSITFNKRIAFFTACIFFTAILFFDRATVFLYFNF